MSEEEAGEYISRCSVEFEAGGYGILGQNERWCAAMDLGCQQEILRQRIDEQIYTRTIFNEMLIARVGLPTRGGSGWLECGGDNEMDCGEYEPVRFSSSVSVSIQDGLRDAVYRSARVSIAIVTSLKSVVERTLFEGGSSNACGPGSSLRFPNKVGGTSFNAACEAHDACYADPLISKSTCDRRLGLDILAAFRVQGGNMLVGAVVAADYYGAVSLFGHLARWRAQNSAPLSGIYPTNARTYVPTYGD